MEQSCCVASLRFLHVITIHISKNVGTACKMETNDRQWFGNHAKLYWIILDQVKIEEIQHIRFWSWEILSFVYGKSTLIFQSDASNTFSKELRQGHVYPCVTSSFDNTLEMVLWKWGDKLLRLWNLYLYFAWHPNVFGNGVVVIHLTATIHLHIHAVIQSPSHAMYEGQELHLMFRGKKRSQ